MARLAKRIAFVLALTAGVGYFVAGLTARFDPWVFLDGDRQPEFLVGTRWRVEATRDQHFVGPPGRAVRTPLVPPVVTTGHLTIGPESKDGGWRADGFDVTSTVDFNALFENGGRTDLGPRRQRVSIVKLRNDWQLQTPAYGGCDCGWSIRGRFGGERFVGRWTAGGFVSIEWGAIRMRRID